MIDPVEVADPAKFAYSAPQKGSTLLSGEPDLHLLALQQSNIVIFLSPGKA